MSSLIADMLDDKSYCLLLLHVTDHDPHCSFIMETVLELFDHISVDELDACNTAMIVRVTSLS